MYLREKIQNRSQLQVRYLNTSEEMMHNQEALAKTKISLETTYEKARKQNLCWVWRTEDAKKGTAILLTTS